MLLILKFVKDSIFGRDSGRKPDCLIFFQEPPGGQKEQCYIAFKRLNGVFAVHRLEKQQFATGASDLTITDNA
jgi:hypothetical protein